MGHIPAWLRPTEEDIQLANGLLDAVGMLKEEQSEQAAMRLQQLRAENTLGNEVGGLHSWALLQAGQIEAAATVARDAIVEFGATPALAFAMAQVFEQENNPAEAFPLYRDLSTLAPRDLLVLSACARTAVACERGADALLYLDRLMLIEPLSVTQKRLRAQALELAGRPEDALSLYEQMSAERPDDFALLADMASASFATAKRSGEVSHYENAVLLLERLTAAAPQHSEAFFMLATARQEIGRNAEAAIAYDRCLEVDPGNVEAGLAYATLLAAGGDAQASADVLLSLLRQPISGKDVERVQSRLMTLRLPEENK
jgi:tetratricopeptide (TPR) repeat protein